MGQNAVQTAKITVKRGQNGLKGVKIAAKWVPRLQKCFKWAQNGLKGLHWLWKVPEGFLKGIYAPGTPEIDTVWDYKADGVLF